MESRKRKSYFRSPRTTNIQYSAQYHKNVYDDSTKFQYFKYPRLQRPPHSSATNMRNPQNFMNVHPIKNPIVNSTKTLFPSIEDKEEAERKKKLSDTANKILSKIKTLNAEKDSAPDVSSGKSSLSSINEVDHDAMKVTESEDDFSKRTTSECKPKRIAHSLNKSKLSSVKKKVIKTVKQTARVNNISKKLEVNKEKVKNFQNRIQHKLINEIMQMPKENLQNMLNNPKINPIMQVKISHLVKENRLLIAQKLRALAESKMNSKDLPTTSQFLVDIDKLIDPVIETDLSVLPYDIIKKMENIFQVQFDYSENEIATKDESSSAMMNDDSKVITLEPSDDSNSVEMIPPELMNVVTDPAQNCKTFGEAPLNNYLPEETTSMNKFSSINEEETVDDCSQFSKDALSPDNLLYECTTDEDEEPDETISSLSERTQQNHTNTTHSNSSFKETLKSRYYSAINKNNGSETEDETLEPVECKEIQNGAETNTFKGTGVEYPVLTEKSDNSHQVQDLSGETTAESCTEVLEDIKPINLQPLCINQTCSIACQTENNLESVATQTVFPLIDSQCLCKASIPKKSTDNTFSSLLNDVNAVQRRINELNERRFMLFLKLAKICPQGEFIADSGTQNNFIEAVTNGNISLTDKLNEFFSKNIIPDFNDKVNKGTKSKNKKKKGKYKK